MVANIFTKIPHHKKASYGPAIWPKDLMICEEKCEQKLEITSVYSTLYLCNKIIPCSIILLPMEWFRLNKL